MFQQQFNRGSVQSFGGTQQRRHSDAQHNVDPAVSADVAVRRQQLQLQIGIRSGVQELLDDLQGRGLIERRPIRSSAVRNRVHIHGAIERAAAPPIPFVHIRALADQIFRRIEMRVGDGLNQRSDSLGIRHVQLGAAIHQDLHAREAAFASGVQHGRQSAIGQVLGARLRTDLRQIFVDMLAGVDVGAMRDQLAYHGGLAFSGSPHERSLFLLVLCGIDVSAMFDQNARGRDVAGTSDDHQSRLTVRAGGLGIGARLQQRFDDGNVAGEGGFRHRRRAKPVSSFCVGAGFQ